MTTSWDDGHVLDHRLAAKLDALGLPGTFYVAPLNGELPTAERLNDNGIRELGQRFEIGGHTLRHRRLPTLPAAEARAEIEQGKAFLEDVLGRSLVSFCYPGGDYAGVHIGMVRDAGFHLARTVKRFSTTEMQPFELRTTMHCYRHLVDLIPAYQAARRRPLPARQLYQEWDLLAIALFDSVLATGGIYHLWGHSWEIDARGDWARLDRVLEHIAARADVSYVDNCELAHLITSPA